MLLRVLSGIFSRKVLRFISVFIFIIALATLTGAVVSMVTDVNLRAHGVTTNATIVNVNVSRSYSRSTSGSYSLTYKYTDLISYKTSDGAPHQASIAGSSGQQAGETIAVVYDPSHPTTVENKSNLTGVWWLGPTLFLLAALALGWLATHLWRRASRQADPQLA